MFLPSFLSRARSQSVAPCVTGVLYYVMSYYAVACMLLLINFFSSLCLFMLLKQLYERCPGLGTKPHFLSQSETSPSFSTINPSRTPSQKNLLTSGCAGTLISFSCLFLTVLSFGSIMLVYLRWAGLPDYYIGLARGLSSLAGFSGALVYPHARKRFGLFKTGENSFLFCSIVRPHSVANSCALCLSVCLSQCLSVSVTMSLCVSVSLCLYICLLVCFCLQQ